MADSLAAAAFSQESHKTRLTNIQMTLNSLKAEPRACPGVGELRDFAT